MREAIEQTKTQIEQYQNMIQNTLSLPQSIMQDVQGQFEKLQNLVTSGFSLTFDAEFDFGKFQESFKTYGQSNGGHGGESYDKIYQEYRKKIQEYIEQVLKQNQAAQKKITEEDSATIQDLFDAAMNTEGQHQALQAANQIAVFMAQQLSEIHTTMLRQVEAETTWAQNHQEKEDIELEQKEIAHGDIPTYTKPRNQHGGR